MGRSKWLALAALLTLTLGASLLVLRMGKPADSAGSTTSISGPESDSVSVVRLFKDPAELPPYTMIDMDGRALSSADLRGKVVLVNFWATWCPPCRAEIPDLVALQKKYGEELVVIGVVSEDESPAEKIKQFAAQYGVNYPIVMETPAIRKVFVELPALPTTFVIDRDGRLAMKHVGMLNAATTEAETRVLAGLDVTTKVERVDSSDKARIAKAVEQKSIPGIDLTALDETQKDAVVQALLVEKCTCPCGLTLGVCRLDDPTCPVSLPAAQEIVKKYSAAR